jgi:hypothetical protein
MTKRKNGDGDLRLEAIIEYDMNELEAMAYKVNLLWLDKSRKIFPNYRHATMAKGDPRKSLIFKICYKLVRETQGVLANDEYHLYVQAQLDVLRHINSGKSTPLIDPNCLVGEKAWKRWKLWKRRYDAICKKPIDKEIQKSPQAILKALEGIERTKEFLAKTIGGDYTFEKIQECYINKNIFRWINLQKISPYYLAISPFAQKLLTEEDHKKINFDVKVYEPCINDLVRKKFQELFPQEGLILQKQLDN